MRALVRINTSKMAMARDEEMKLTGWYQPDQKPVRVGWYEREYRQGPVLDYWNGKHFCYLKGGSACWTQDRKWRGITK